MNGPRKPWLIALALSLTLNLFLLGFGTARWLHARAHQTGHEGSFERPGRRHRSMLEGRSHVLREALQPRREALRAQRLQLREAQEAVRDALIAEPLDRAALQRSLERLRDATAGSQRVMHDALAETAPNLTQPQRAELARSVRLFGPER